MANELHDMKHGGMKNERNFLHTSVLIYVEAFFLLPQRNYDKTVENERKEGREHLLVVETKTGKGMKKSAKNKSFKLD